MNQIVSPVAAVFPDALERFLRNRLLARLAPLRHGGLRLCDALGEVLLGDPAASLQVTLEVHDPAFYRALATQGSVGAGGAYIDGQWRCSDLVALVRLLLRNRELLDGMEGGAARLGGWALRTWNLARRNTRAGSRRNIAAHYDLGNAFFQLFLSPDMMYSSALFEHEDEALEDASRRKLDRICTLLRLQPGDRVVEIGTGWGGFALHAAMHYGCHVTTTTISAEQHKLAAARIREAGLGDKITLLNSDYRDLRGQYDRLVSIEMIEAVGDKHLPGFFRTCGGLLKPDGLALLQAITVPDRAYKAYLKSPDFINLYIFPGGCCPSVQAMTGAAAGATDLRLVQLQDLTPHYARTLQEWRRAFTASLPAVRALGYDERFIRMWHCYFCYCEGAFAEQYTGVVQLLYARPGHRIGPLSEVL